MPITLVAIHGNVVLARVGLQKDDCGILLYSSVARADEVEVIEKPREGSVIIACPSLQCFVWLSTIRDQRDQSNADSCEIPTEIRYVNHAVLRRL